MMKNSIENIIKENKIMVIDGSMSTPLENRGVSLNSKLWTAKILAEQPRTDQTGSQKLLQSRSRLWDHMQLSGIHSRTYGKWIYVRRSRKFDTQCC